MLVIVVRVQCLRLQVHEEMEEGRDRDFLGLKAREGCRYVLSWLVKRKGFLCIANSEFLIQNQCKGKPAHGTLHL